MIQFSFSNSLFDFNCFEKLKSKLRESNRPLKHIYIVGNTQIEKWCPIRDNTCRTENLNFIESFKTDEYAIGVSHKNATCDLLVYYNRISIWTLDSNFKIKKTLLPTLATTCAIWYHDKKQDKKFLIIGCESGSVNVWDWEKNQVIQTIQSPSFCITKLLVIDQSQELLVVCTNHVRLWSLETFEWIRSFENSCFTTDLCFLDNDKKLFATANRKILKSNGNDSIKIWNKKTGECLFVENMDDKITGLLYSSVLNSLISCGNGKEIKVWKLITSPLKVSLQLDFKVNACLPDYEKQMLLIDEKDQTRVLITNVIMDNGHDIHTTKLQILDLISRRIIWETDAGGYENVIGVFIE